MSKTWEHMTLPPINTRGLRTFIRRHPDTASPSNTKRRCTTHISLTGTARVRFCTKPKLRDCTPRNASVRRRPQ